ncbi:triose-phosphate transporter family-domain-containing protein [Aspergillus egyptiacus]|nr:triose-phosphate transporter family-domain-containing protein [Aspergillus egyptiacus]
MSPDGTGPSKAGHLLSQTLRRRTPLLLLLAITLIIIYPFRSTLVPVQPFEGSATGTTVSPSALESPSDNAAAAVAAGLEASSRSISAHDLLSRPISRDLTSIPKIIHQTWFPAGSNMSESAAGWVETMKKHHPDWEYVLWDDESDEALVREYFPWFLETYRSLPQEINRADMARNFYMFLFGGMYADVDTEALRSVNSLFAAHDVTLKPHWDALSADSTEKTVQRAFMGRMAHTLDPEGLGAIPNGWMASPPGHPFWLLPVLAVMENPKGDGSASLLTGQRNWIFWSNFTILFNKYLLESTPFPILLTTWHLLFATLATQTLAKTTSLLNARHAIPMSPRLYMTKIAPIGLLYSGSLVCSNMAYLYLNVGFIQMLKASGPVITLLTSYLWGTTSLTLSKTLNILFITLSVALTVSGEVGGFRWLGVAIQLVSLVFDAMRLVLMEVLTSSSSSSSSSSSGSGYGYGYTVGKENEGQEEEEEQRQQQQQEEQGEEDEKKSNILSEQDREGREGSVARIRKMDPLVSLYYSAPICALMNAILAWKGEVAPFLEASSDTASSSHTNGDAAAATGGGGGGLINLILTTGPALLLANAVVGFMLNVAVFTLIGKTSSLAMTLVSVPKNILLIVASVVLWGTRVSGLQMVGYAGALAGLVVYSGGDLGLVRGCFGRVWRGRTRGRGRCILI